MILAKCISENFAVTNTVIPRIASHIVHFYCIETHCFKALVSLLQMYTTMH